MRNCKKCNKEYIAKMSYQKFCSDKCRNLWHKPVNEIIIKNCKLCNLEFQSSHPNHLFCSSKCSKKTNNIKARIITKINNNMSGINRLIDWLEENKDLKLSPEFIKLQAQVFALEEKFNMNYFESVTNIFNKKIDENIKNEKTQNEKLYINYLHSQK